jgi:hypothetical protein
MARAAPARRHGSRHGSRTLLAPVAALSGLVLSWLIFYIGGQILVEIAAHAERTWRIH